MTIATFLHDNHNQVQVLKKCFDGFADEEGAIPADQVNHFVFLFSFEFFNLYKKSPFL